MSETSDLISVVIPIYNVAPYIEASITSMLCQSYSNLEIILIDGGSSDGTLQRLDRFKDPRLRLIGGDRRRGFLLSLNEGIQAAHGEWIVRMDGDDICHPCRLERQLVFLKAHPMAVMVGTRSGYVTPGGYLMYRRGFGEKGVQEVSTYSLTTNTTDVTDGSMMFPRRLAIDVGMYDERFLMKEISLWYRLLTRGPGFVIGTCDYWILIREGSLTYGHMIADTVWRAVREHYDPDGFRKAYPNPKPPTPAEARIRFHFHNLLICAAAGDWRAAVKQAWFVCRCKSFDVMLYRRVLLGLLGRDTLHFWHRPWRRFPPEFVPFTPENETVASVLTRLGVRLPRNNKRQPEDRYQSHQEDSL